MHGGGLRTMAILLLVGLVVAACGPARSDEPHSAPPADQRVGPKRFTAAIRGFPQSVSTMIDSAGAGSTAGLREVQELLNSSVAISDGDGRLRPQLAESVPTLENGLWKVLPDGGMETTWRLRAGILWHDGTPF